MTLLPFSIGILLAIALTMSVIFFVLLPFVKPAGAARIYDPESATYKKLLAKINGNIQERVLSIREQASPRQFCEFCGDLALPDHDCRRRSV